VEVSFDSIWVHDHFGVFGSFFGVSGFEINLKKRENRKREERKEFIPHNP
jgi:hypothetical protein